MEYQDRKVESDGRCPCCNSINYSRSFSDTQEDNAFFNCTCECGKSFTETFILKFQEWEI